MKRMNDAAEDDWDSCFMEYYKHQKDSLQKRYENPDLEIVRMLWKRPNFRAVLKRQKVDLHLVHRAVGPRSGGYMADEAHASWYISPEYGHESKVARELK